MTITKRTFTTEEKVAIERRSLIIEKILSGVNNEMEYLYSRWLDESRYENFKEYEEIMMAMIDKLDLNVKFIKGTKRPFGFLIYIEDIKFEYKINSTKISLFRYSK